MSNADAETKLAKIYKAARNGATIYYFNDDVDEGEEGSWCKFSAQQFLEQSWSIYDVDNLRIGR